MTTSPHLDDELLSAHLDGDDVTGADHLAGCDECRSRLEVLRSVAAAVGAPVPPPSAQQRDAAVAAALRAPVISLDARRRRRHSALLAAAASVVVVLGVLVVTSGDDKASDGGSTAALSDAAGDSARFEGGDLGDQSDPQVLALRLRAAVEPETTATESADSAAGAGAASTTTAPSQAPEAQATSRQAVRSSGDAAFSTADPDCTKTVAQEYGRGLGALVYKAVLRWQGTPAVVLVYPITDAKGSLDHQALVMERGSCRLLVAQAI